MEFIVELDVTECTECFASVVAIADGASAEGVLDVRDVDYRQTALTALVQTEDAHGHTAYERFAPSGPIALLPYEHRYALVWTTQPDQAHCVWNCVLARLLRV